MGRISMPQGKGNLMHNRRDYEKYGKPIPDNIDSSKTKDNIVFCDNNIREFYQKIFGDALAAYNAKQKRSDRKIADYFDHILKSKNGEKAFYEDVLQWGKKEDFENNPKLRKLAAQALEEYIEAFELRNPNLKLLGAYIHVDEASPHLHFDYIPVAHGYKRGLDTRNSLDKALQEQGIELKERKKKLKNKETGEIEEVILKDEGRYNNRTMSWKEREREYFKSICDKLGLEVEAERKARGSVTVEVYKEIKEEVLADVKEEAEKIVSDATYEAEDIISKAEVSAKEITDKKEKEMADKMVEIQQNAYNDEIDRLRADSSLVNEVKQQMIDEAPEELKNAVKEQIRADITPTVKKELHQELFDEVKESFDGSSPEYQEVIAAGIDNPNIENHVMRNEDGTLKLTENSLPYFVKRNYHISPEDTVELAAVDYPDKIKMPFIKKIFNEFRRIMVTIKDKLLSEVNEYKTAAEEMLGLVSEKELVDHQHEIAMFIEEKDLSKYNLSINSEKEDVHAVIQKLKDEKIDEYHKSPSISSRTSENDYIKEFFMTPLISTLYDLMSKLESYKTIKESPRSIDDVKNDILAKKAFINKQNSRT